MLCDHGYPMTGSRSLPLMRVFGIRIGVNDSWFLILFVVIFVLWDSLSRTLDASDTTVYAVAVVAAASFFVSILLHELGHALAARREGIAVEGIDLFLFGGLMKMRSEPRSPGAEFRVAAAGPLVTALIIGVGIGAGALLTGPGDLADAAQLSGTQLDVATQLISLVVAINILLLGFNLLPAYPLDGGRIARAAVWKATGDRIRATRTAAQLGRGFSFLMIGFGIYLFATGNQFNGIWLAVLGWMIGQSASGALAQSAFSERLEGVTVADIMDAEPVTIPSATPAIRAYEDWFLRYQGYDWFAVVDDDARYVGRAFRAPVEEAALGANASTPVGQISGADAEGRVADSASLDALVRSEPLRRLGALMAVDPEGRLRGIVTLEMVQQALRAHLVAPG